MPTAHSFAQGTWTPKAPLATAGRTGAVAFTIGYRGYLGTGGGATGGTFYDDFWEYDPIADSWTQKANFLGAEREYAIGFSIGNYGYIGTGRGSGGSYNDFWQYDPIANTWTQVANFGGVARYTSVGFSVAGKGYIGTGVDDAGNSLQDVWEYDTLSNTWTAKANYLGGNRREIDRAVFVICNKVYMGTGVDNTNLYNDFWEYDPIVDTWTQKTNFPGTPRFGSTGFSIGSRGFLGLGRIINNSVADFWKYNPFTNSWSAVSAFPGGARYDSPSFVINNKAYVGTGLSAVTFNNDLWEFTPDSIIGVVTAAIISSSNTICAGQSVTLSASGGSSYSWSNGSTNNPIIVSPTATTIYSVIVKDTTSCGGSNMATVTISVTTVTAIAGPNSTICAGQNATLTASGGTNYSWNTGASSSSLTVSPTLTTTYSVIVTDIICSGSDTVAVTISVTAVTAVIACKDVCAGTSTTLSVTGGTNYVWSSGAVTSSISVSPAATTSYSVIVSIGSCADTTDCTVNVFPTPVVTTNGITDVTCTGGSDGTATVAAAGGSPPYTYLWNPTAAATTTATGLLAGNYVVTVTDANGCSQVQTITINEPASVLLSVPNAFSPNNDGENDKFCLQGNEYCIKELRIIIYDRWGEQVYESNDKNFCWDGIYKDKPLNTAMFVYYLEAILVSDEQRTKKGNISLIR